MRLYEVERVFFCFVCLFVSWSSDLAFSCRSFTLHEVVYMLAEDGSIEAADSYRYSPFPRLKNVPKDVTYELRDSLTRD